MRSESREIPCPRCGKPVAWAGRGENPAFPFCSKRCKLIDLGQWVDGEHRISTPSPDGPGETHET